MPHDSTSIVTHPRVAIYCRVSTAAQEDNSSLETQETRCRDYATKQGWEVVRVFREIHTGSELFERPQLASLREAVRGKDCDMVLAYALDRVSRSQAHFGFLLSEWDHLGVGLALVTEELADTAEGRLLQSVRGFVAEIERLKIRERTQRGVQARVRSGKPIPGQKAPYGYMWRDAKRSGYVVNDEEYPIVRRIYESILQGNTLRATAQALTREGVQTPTGRAKRWEVATLHTILKNPVYTGHPAAYRTKVERVKGRNSVRYQPPSSWVELPGDIAPAIVSEGEFTAVQSRLDMNRAASPRHNANPEATLLRCGIGRCGYCGYPLQVTRRKDKPHMYRCHPLGRERHECPSFGVMAHILDPAVWESVELVLLDPHIIAREVAHRRNQDPFEADIKALERRLQDIDKRRQRLARLIASLEDDDVEAPLVAELKQLGQEAKELRSEHGRLTTLAGAREADTEALASVMSWCERVSTNLKTLTYREKRLILEALGVSVRVFRVDHNPRWELTMAPLPIVPSESDPFVFSFPR